MATGIVSVAAADHRYWRISAALLGVAVVAFGILIGATVLGRFAFGDLRSPDVALRLFTFVAACAVLAARLEWQPVVTWVLAGVAAAAWLALSPLAVAAMWRARPELRSQAHGSWELASVATSGLTIVAADLSSQGPARCGGSRPHFGCSPWAPTS